MNSRLPAVKTIMQDYGLTLAAVSHRANCSMVEAYQALHLRHFSLCPLLVIARVRRGIEDELLERGWAGRPQQLWVDYDAVLERHLRHSGNAPQHHQYTGFALSR